MQLALSADFVRSVCTPHFEEVHCSVQQMPAGPSVSREMLRAKCEPFFDKMIVALQQAIQQSQTDVGDSFHSTCYPHAFSLERDDMSTDADDSAAFASIFSVPSEGDDSIDSMSDTVSSSIAKENSDAANEVEKSTMVCRHWKSKGWCRLGTQCKFLHPEHKRGICTNDRCTRDSKVSVSTTASSGAECMMPLAPSAVRRKRAGQKTSTKGQTAQLRNDETDSRPQFSCLPTTYFPSISPAPVTWFEAGAR